MGKLSESRPITAERYKLRMKSDKPDPDGSKRMTKEQEAYRKLLKEKLKVK